MQTIFCAVSEDGSCSSEVWSDIDVCTGDDNYCFNSYSIIIFLSNLAITSSCKSDLSSSMSHDSDCEESS